MKTSYPTIKLFGFTLIEVMITVAIIAILAAIAYPSYEQYVLRSRRTEAISQLLDLQQKQEKWRATHTTYGTTTDLGGKPSNPYYDINVITNTALAYTIRATALGSQVNDKEGSTSCTPLEINQNNDKGPAGCWKK